MTSQDTSRIVLGLILLSFFPPVGSAAHCPGQGKRPNVLLLCIDDLRPELACFGKDYIRSPHIDKLADSGRVFRRHYVQAPTCGASRFTLLTGCYGAAGNDALFLRAQQLETSPDKVSPAMPAWFRQHGYVTVSVGKVSHHPGGRGGDDWDDRTVLEMPLSWDRHLLPAGPWRHPRGAMHGLARGEIRDKVENMDVFQTVEGPDSLYPDGLITEEAVRQLDLLSQDSQPFFLAVGIIRPHLPFGAPAKYFEPYRRAQLPPIPHPAKPRGKTTWHGSSEFMKYNRWGRNPNEDAAFATEVRKHYAACVSYADAQVGRVLARLAALGLQDNTIVVLWGDHGWHLGEHAIWGKHALFEESLHSPLIIRYPGMPQAGAATQAVVETLDVFPTLCDLAGLTAPAALQGVSLRPILEEPAAPGHAAVSYMRKAKTIRNDKTIRTAKTIRTDNYRLIAHDNGQVELYDHRSAEKETRNIASEHPEEVQALLGLLERRLAK